MSRIASVWLPRWPILRFFAAQAQNSSQGQEQVNPDLPFALSVEVSGGPRIAAVNEAAEAMGIMVGDTLADARAKTGISQVRIADPGADDAALRRLALWATRYTPAVSLFDEESGADGFFLDVTGSSHLFGGEEELLADLSKQLERFGLWARLAIADTAGAAWALSRFHPSACVVLPSGKEIEALAGLPIAALRLPAAMCSTLRRLGFKRVRALIDAPRAPLAARFEKDLLKRLDQALGRIQEPLVFIALQPVYHGLRHLLEPIFSQEAVVAVATRLMQGILPALDRDGVGVRSLRLALYRVDGETVTADIGLSQPTRSPEHVARLIALKLDRVDVTREAGFGFETVSLSVTGSERMKARQGALSSAVGDPLSQEHCAALVDGLRQRLGKESVRWIAPVESHLPEKAEVFTPDEAAPWPAADKTHQRPLLLLPRAEPTDVLALVPEGPPRRFRWRGAMHAVVHSEGPERIASEWWRHRTQQPTRDYYVVEDDAGHRFWLFREGLYGRETTSPRWFVHGLFA